MTIFFKFYLLIFGCAGSSLLWGLFSRVASWSYSLVRLCMLLIAVTCCRAGALGSQASIAEAVYVDPRLQSTGSIVLAHRHVLLCSTWDAPGQGIESMSPPLAD